MQEYFTLQGRVAFQDNVSHPRSRAAPPRSTLGGGSRHTQCSASVAREGFTVPACSHNSSQGKGCSCSHLRTEALLQKAYTHTPAISLYPKPKVHQGTGQYFELLGSACHYVESVHKRCQEQGCILNLPFAKKQKGGFCVHALRQQPILQKAEVLHIQGTKQPAFSMQQSRTLHSPVRQTDDFLPAIPTTIQVSWGLAGAVP